MNYLLATPATGAQKSPGLTELWICDKSALTTIATPVASPATQAEKVTIDGPHVAAALDGFRRLVVSTKKSEWEAKRVGDEDAGSIEFDTKIFVPGITTALAAFLFDSPELILLVANGPCGTTEYLQSGTECDGCRIAEATAKSGKFGGTDVKGVEITLRSFQASLLFYTDAIPVP